MLKLKGKFIQTLFNLFGKTIYAHKANGILKLEIFNKTNDTDCYHTIIQLLKFYKPKVVFDIGANEGNWTENLIKLSNSVTDIFLFEPQLKLNEIISQKLKAYSVNSKVFNIGLSNKKSKNTIKGGGPSASILEVKTNYAFSKELTDEFEEIEIYSLDEFFDENKLIQPDLIKIDVQGLEYEILEGANITLNQCKFLIVELSFDEFYKNQQPLWKIFKLLDEKGFILADTGFEWRKNYDFKNRLLQIDGIFYNKNLVQLD
ncbi:MAG: FkbM family methyltransferase [Bacteroidia bacterium]